MSEGPRNPSGNVEQRLKSIPHEKVIATFSGTRKTERGLHEKFAHLRLTGEWFQATPDLIAFAEALEVASRRATLQRTGGAELKAGH